ncbi:hypothetical protein PUN28_006970 [Cardiocondyla obscurior]|uniref:Uncharacterized protein n=1 Tax=Cardiocondyla obscurior TaxID=286306 RepID=A0AAW2G4A9_9HYME
MRHIRTWIYRYRNLSEPDVLLRWVGQFPRDKKVDRGGRYVEIFRDKYLPWYIHTNDAINSHLYAYVYRFCYWISAGWLGCLPACLVIVSATDYRDGGLYCPMNITHVHAFITLRSFACRNLRHPQFSPSS